MSIASEASKLLTNKYFLYFMVFLAATNVLGYLVTNKINAVIFFALVGLLTHQFSKNMAVVLLVSVIATNFLMANKRIREGLENETDNQPTTDTTSQSGPLNNIDVKDSDIADAIPAVKNAKNGEKIVKDKLSNVDGAKSENIPGKVVDLNNEDMNKQTNEDEPYGAGAVIQSKKTKSNENFGPRLDYAATIEQSYQNLDQLLGSDSIKQLTNDTQKLMKQQQTLFDTMQNMVPVLQGAQNLLKDFKIDGLAESLKGMNGLANSPIPNIPQK